MWYDIVVRLLPETEKKQRHRALGLEKIDPLKGITTYTIFGSFPPKTAGRFMTVPDRKLSRKKNGEKGAIGRFSGCFGFYQLRAGSLN